ncbi:MAG: DUF72 domain-containing protein [Spirochaetota bacterium]
MAHDDRSAGRALIGTSGWQYDSWVGSFYGGRPATLKEYAAHFRTVEVNSTFYGLPDRESVDAWTAQVRDREFVFSVKASRYLTHMKKLKDAAEPLDRLFDSISPFGDSLEVVLFQLPPHWRSNPDRLAAVLDELPDRYRYAFEFRDPSWYNDRVYDLLRDHGAAFCIYHLAGHLSPKVVTADFVYVRLHGAGAGYEGSYASEDLAGWTGAITAWRRSGKDVYLYFDNDQEAAAPRDAARLAEMVS